MPLSSGQVLNNRYRIQTLLGQGGFGFVYQAWDLNLNMPVAVKELSSASPLADQQFSVEARRLASLRHPNLPYVVDHFTLPDQGQYLVMEYVDGQNLQSLLKQAGRDCQAPSAGLDNPCAECLEYLHSQSPRLSIVISSRSISRFHRKTASCW
jgi:serine/threonine protein kinase